MTITREQEIWAMALWVDREHGEDAEEFIAGKVLHFEELGDDGGQKVWIQVARRYAQLKDVVNAERSWLGPIDDIEDEREFFPANMKPYSGTDRGRRS